jgi:hypothetical protein
MNSQMIRHLLYAFKKQWGGQFDYIQILTSEADARTGDRNIQRTVLRFPAVKLPITQARKFIQDIGYLAANKNFTYGGLNDFNTVTLLIDINDLPNGFKIDLNGYLIHDQKRYERVSFSNLAGAAYLLVARGVEGALPYARISEYAQSTLQIQSRATYELN